MRIQKVLFPTDFSPISEGAFPYAVHIAREHQAELHMLHADVLQEDDPWGSGQPSPDIEKLRTVRDGWAKERLAEVAKDPAIADLTVFQEVCWDNSAAGPIAEYAGQEGVDLVVMGTHGARGVRKWLLGSTAAEVIRTAPCSVLIVPPRGNPHQKPSFRRILAPVDFSGFSREGLAVACELTLGYGARLELLHVRGNNGRPAGHHAGTVSAVGSKADLNTQTEDALSSFFEEVAGRRGIPAGCNIREGHPGREIPRFAESQGCDLIVMASLGITGIDRFLLGSTAERVIGGAHCPVLVVRPSGRSLLA